MPTDVPGVRQHAAARRGGGRLALREHVVPGAAAPQPRALRVALGDEHRRARRVARRSAARAGAGPATSPTCITSKAETLEELVVTPRDPKSERAGPASWARSAATSSSRSSAARSNDLSRLVYALGIRHVGEKAAATLARYFRTMERLMAGAGRSAAGGAGNRPGRRGVGPRVRGGAAQPGARRQAEAAGVNMASQAPEPAAEQPGPLAGKVVRPHRHAGVDDARGGDGDARTARARGWRARSARRRATSSSAPTPGASSRRRRKLGVETLDEDGLPRSYNGRMT